MKNVLSSSCVALLCAWLPAQLDPDGPALSPFRGMRRVETVLEVQVLDDTWHELVAVAGVDAATLQREARRLCGDRDWKRITEDLPALLDAMGHPVDGVHVDVQVRDLVTGDQRTFESVEMTAENRRRVKQANEAPMLRKVPVIGDVFGQRLTAEAVAADLDHLRGLLETRYAYLGLRAVDLDACFAAARAQLGDGERTRRSMARAVDALLRQFGDGHSRVRDQVDFGPWTPFLVQQVAGGHVAFRPDRSGFVDPERPYLVAIDGVPLSRWLDAAAPRVTRGSAAMQARDAERALRDIGGLRRTLGLPQPKDVTLTLRGAGGERDVALEVSGKATYGAWPRRETGVLEGGVGYLRIASMDDDPAFLDAIDAAMQRFRDTKGLVVDVRGNGGGTRDALRRFAPYVLPEGRAVVGNVAAVLLEDGAAAPPDALAGRGLYRADWAGWSDRQRAAIADCLKSFRPSWPLPRGRFSPWHFLVLDRADNPQAFSYDRPVVVLVDRACFSATDVFAAALQAIPGVTLVGEPTSGGSGRAKRYRLPNSGVELQLSSMASYRPDGVLFDGHGVEPDVVVETVASDLIGASDTALARALELLR